MVAFGRIGVGDGSAFLKLIERYPAGGAHPYFALWHLAPLGPAALPAAPAAIEALAVPDTDETRGLLEAARKALLAMGPGAIPALERAARDDERASVRHWSHVTLGHLGSVAAVEHALAAGLRDPSAWVRSGAVRGLTTLHAKSAARTLVDALRPAADDPAVAVRAGVAAALVRRFEQDPRLIGPWVRRFVGDEAAQVRSCAVGWLQGDGGHAEVFAALVDAACDPDSVTRHVVEARLASVGTADARRGVLRWWVVPRALWRPAVLALALTLAWLALAARFPARRPHGAWRWPLQLAWTATVPLALACGGVAYATTRPWTTGFLPQPTFGLVSVPVAATGTTAFVVLMAAAAVCARKPASPSEDASPPVSTTDSSSGLHGSPGRTR